jgi:periplasmic copper chaperone A
MMSVRRGTWGHVGGFLAVTMLAAGLYSGQASAHVTVDSLGVAEQGGFAKIGFSVPTERDDAGTVAIQVQLPTDHPLAFVSVQPKPGWDVATTTRTLDEPIEAFGTTITEVTDTISWTATGDTQIGPGQFDQFWISAGAMPADVSELGFPTIQTYSSGEEVAWIEPFPAGGEEPELPVPTLALVAPASGAGESGAAVPAEPTTTPEDTDSGDSSNTLAVIALIVGALGLLVGGAGLMIARNATRGATPA